MSNKFVVIGLGVFGYNLALKLMEKGAEVVAVDSKMDLVDEIQNEVTYAVCLDSTDEKALNSLGLKDFDAGIVCVGENFETALLTSVVLKNSGIKRVIARASNPIHIKILKAVGIDEVITPGLEAAVKLSFSLFHQKLLDIIHIDERTSVAKITAPTAFVGKTIGGLNLRARFGINVIAIDRMDDEDEKTEQTVQSNPCADTIISENDILVVIGSAESLEKLTENT
jgi:trk system potassium uptake protein TrkA